jgi:hypothetical protein
VCIIQIKEADKPTEGESKMELNINGVRVRKIQNNPNPQFYTYEWFNSEWKKWCRARHNSKMHKEVQNRMK